MQMRGIVTALALLLAAPAAAQPITDETIHKLRTTREIAIGHREASIPFSYIDPAEGPIGFSIDLCRRVVDRLAAGLGTGPITMRFVPVTPQNRTILLQNGTVDLECGSTSNTMERQKQVAFSLNIFATEVRMLVRKDGGVSQFTDLRGKVIATTAGATADQLIKEAAKAAGFEPRIAYGKDHSESFLLLESGRAAAFVMDDILLAGLVANSKAPDGLAITGKGMRAEPYALMIRREDREFKAAVDAALAALMRDGTYAELYRKWFEQPVPPRGVNFKFPMSPLVRMLIADPNDQGV